MQSIQVLKTGYYVPPHILTNQNLEQMVATSDEWITTRTGIQTRHIVKQENNIDLAYNATKKMLEGIDKSKIRYLIVATFSNEYATPSLACLLQKKLGLDSSVMAFDINAACSGFVYGLKLMNSLLKENEYGLIIGSEVLSKLVDYQDRSTCILFGDGAGALLVTSKQGLYYDAMYASGNDHDLYCKKDGYLNMNGKEIFKFAVHVIPSLINELLEKSQLSLEDIDHIVCHQANARIIQYVTKKLKVKKDLFYMNLQHYGNTSAASIPLALANMNEKGLLKSGDKIICIGFGSGLTWGANLFEW